MTTLVWLSNQSWATFRCRGLSQQLVWLCPSLRSLNVVCRLSVRKLPCAGSATAEEEFVFLSL